MEYVLKDGTVITDADIERMAEEIERGELPGEWSGEIVYGCPEGTDKEATSSALGSEARKNRRRSDC